MRWLLLILSIVSIDAMSEQGAVYDEPVTIRSIAIQAAYDANTDLLEGELIDAGMYAHSNVYCTRPEQLWVGALEEENVEPCIESRSFLIRDTIEKEIYRDEEGRCVETTRFWSVSVSVFADGSTEVKPRSHGGSGRSLRDCGLEDDVESPKSGCAKLCTEDELPNF